MLKRTVGWFRGQGAITAFVMIFCAAIAMICPAASAQTCATYPHTLTNGSPANATDVMDNFAAVGSCAAPSVDSYGGFCLSSSVTLTGTAATPLSFIGNVAAGAYTVYIHGVANDVPAAVIAVAVSSWGAFGAGATINALASSAGLDGTTVAVVTWPSGANYPSLAKSSGSYDGTYRVRVCGI